MSKAISVTDTIAGAPLSLSFLVERMCEGNRVRVQPKQSCEISHHCGFAGTSQTTIPGLSLVASASAMCGLRPFGESRMVGSRV